MAFTAFKTWVANAALSYLEFNTYVRDNGNYLYARKGFLQVVQSTTLLANFSPPSTTLGDVPQLTVPITTSGGMLFIELINKDAAATNTTSGDGNIFQTNGARPITVSCSVDAVRLPGYNVFPSTYGATQDFPYLKWVYTPGAGLHTVKLQMRGSDGNGAGTLTIGDATGMMLMVTEIGV